MKPPAQRHTAAGSTGRTGIQVNRALRPGLLLFLVLSPSGLSLLPHRHRARAKHTLPPTHTHTLFIYTLRDHTGHTGPQSQKQEAHIHPPQKCHTGRHAVHKHFKHFAETPSKVTQPPHTDTPPPSSTLISTLHKHTEHTLRVQGVYVSRANASHKHAMHVARKHTSHP